VKAGEGYALDGRERCQFVVCCMYFVDMGRCEHDFLEKGKEGRVVLESSEAKNGKDREAVGLPALLVENKLPEAICIG
jgi:hypothetical protein